MSVPAFLSTSHRYLRTNGVTDVATIVSDIRSELVTNGSPAWTEPSTALFQSPADANGRWFDILLTVTTSTKLDMRTRDDRGVTVGTRRMWIDAGGTDIVYCTGEAHCFIIALRATPENLRAGLLDLTPEGQKAHLAYTWCGGYRDTSDNTNEITCDYQYLLNLNISAYQHNRYIEILYTNAGATQQYLTATGIYMFRPAFTHGYAATGNFTQFGRVMQVFMGSSALVAGTLYDIPIDVGVTAKFTPIGGNQGTMTLLIRAD